MKIFCFLICFILIFTSLTGCTSTKVNETSTTQNTYTAESQCILTPETKPFSMISSTEITLYGSGNSNGFYEIFRNDDNSANIMYTDYKSKKQIYLCNQPNCEHNSEICTSWIQPTSANIYIAATEKNLLLVHSDHTGTSASYIEIMNLDGSDRREFYKFENTCEIENGIAANDTGIVLEITEYITNDGSNIPEQHPILLYIDFATQSATELYSIPIQKHDITEPGSTALFFRGTSNSGFILKTISLDNYEIVSDDPETTYKNMQNSTTHTIYELPFNGEGIKTLLTFKSNECYEEVFGQHLFFIRNNGEGHFSLCKQNTSTGETSTLINDFSETFLQNTAVLSSVDDIVIRNLVDNNLILNIFTNDYVSEKGDIEVTYTGMCVDINSGESHELTLTNHYNATTVPVSIIAQTDNSLLVHASIKEEYIANNLLPNVVRSLGLISVEDYLSSNPNYIMIDSIRKVQQ